MNVLRLCGSVALASLTTAGVVFAQDSLLDPGPAVAEERQAGWDYEQSVAPPTPTQIIQHKAQTRGAQRMSRIAAMEWYGHSKARPRAIATPFTGLYGSQFQGYQHGRPSAFYATRPVVVVTK